MHRGKGRSLCFCTIDHNTNEFKTRRGGFNVRLAREQLQATEFAVATGVTFFNARDALRNLLCQLGLWLSGTDWRQVSRRLAIYE
jgi:hypothetical protein